MKTLPEILETLFSGELYDELHGAFIKVRSTKQIDEAQEAIAKELMGCLPEKIKYIGDEIMGMRIAVNEAIRGAGWQLKSKEEIEAYNQALDEVRARLTAFIGGEK